MQPEPSLARILLGFQSFQEPLFTCPLQKERNLLTAITVAPDLDTCHLDRYCVFKTLWNCSPYDSNGQQERSEFSKPRCGAQEHADLPCSMAESVFHLRKGSMWSGSDDHKEASRVDLLPSSPWRTCSVCVFTGHCSLFSWQQWGGRHCAGWMVCGPLSSTSFPSPSLLLCPCPCLNTGTLPHHRDPASWEQVFMQSSNFSKLFPFPSQPPYTNCLHSLIWVL